MSNVRCAEAVRSSVHQTTREFRSRRRSCLTAFLVVLGITFLQATPGLSQDPDAGVRYHPTRVVVRFKNGTTPTAKSAAHAAAQSLRTVRDFDDFVAGLQVVEVAEGSVIAAATAMTLGKS